jgi:hypothetical protein
LLCSSAAAGLARDCPQSLIAVGHKRYPTLAAKPEGRLGLVAILVRPPKGASHLSLGSEGHLRGSLKAHTSSEASSGERHQGPTSQTSAIWARTEVGWLLACAQVVQTAGGGGGLEGKACQDIRTGNLCFQFPLGFAKKGERSHKKNLSLSGWEGLDVSWD